MYVVLVFVFLYNKTGPQIIFIFIFVQVTEGKDFGDFVLIKLSFDYFSTLVYKCLS